MLWIWTNDVDKVVTKPIIECNITYWISIFTKDSQDLLPHMSILKALGEKKKSGLQNRNLYSKIGSISFCGLLRRRFTMAEILNFAPNIPNCTMRAALSATLSPNCFILFILNWVSLVCIFHFLKRSHNFSVNFWKSGNSGPSDRAPTWSESQTYFWSGLG